MKQEYAKRLAELERRIAAIERAARIADVKVAQARQTRKTSATR